MLNCSIIASASSLSSSSDSFATSGGLKKWKNESLFTFSCTIRVCPLFLPFLARCFFSLVSKVRHFPSFQSMSVPVTFSNSGSSSPRRLPTSYTFVRQVLVKKGFSLKWNDRVNPDMSCLSSQRTSTRKPSASTSVSSMISASIPRRAIAWSQNLGTPFSASESAAAPFLLALSSSACAAASSAGMATSVSPVTTPFRCSKSGAYFFLYFSSSSHRSCSYSF
mmetsp:Transcript_44400/g.100387  ORF Transcript_44400/g.100387 Transcript_44400/m.100387 type:complete len:222 (-) Transcript_44400:368-1033(-)